jgi:hypothetical protein
VGGASRLFKCPDWVRTGGFRPFRVVWFLGALALALPLFAHGCHGDHVDHEPVLAPFRLNGDDR